ncbi:MAG: hypothetical protein QOD10_2336 [Mycobacterium sp.]|jgi:hypothetical protein|nr:hypothetical protein [Mycobacterium sp.]
MAADEVSAAVQSIFATHAQAYQSVSAQMAAFHSQFMSLLNGGAASYLRTEITNAQQALAGASTPVSAAGRITSGPGGSTVVTLLNAGPLKITESLLSNRTASISFNLPPFSFTEPVPLSLAEFLFHSGL